MVGLRSTYSSSRTSTFIYVIISSGQVKVWDLRAGLSPTLVVHPGDTTADVWSVAFGTYSCGCDPRQLSPMSIKKMIFLLTFTI